jgi:hypothetical protein
VQSGFYTKTSNHSYAQRITVFNTKATVVEWLKIVDQMPVSEDARIAVKLMSPVLTVPSQAAGFASSGGALMLGNSKKRLLVL